MATLYVRNVPDQLYRLVQELAREDAQSISAKVITLLSDATERAQRKQRRLQAMTDIEACHRAFRPAGDGKDSVTLLREDRSR